MRRRLFTVFSALSLLQCVLLIATWLYQRLEFRRFLDSLGDNVLLHDSHTTVYVFGVAVPLSTAVAATAALPLLWIAAWVRRLLACRRRRPGLCPTCGYDLRATPERCPECGRKAAPIQT